VIEHCESLTSKGIVKLIVATVNDS